MNVQLKSLLHEFSRFASVGLLVTALGSALIFFSYNILHLGYWGASASSYAMASVVSYYLNKRITFNANGAWKTLAPKFFLNIVCCYLVAYRVAQPVIQYFLAKSPLQENVALLLGIVLFTLLNYLGQKFFVFRAV